MKAAGLLWEAQLQQRRADPAKTVARPATPHCMPRLLEPHATALAVSEQGRRVLGLFTPGQMQSSLRVDGT